MRGQPQPQDRRTPLGHWTADEGVSLTSRGHGLKAHTTPPSRAGLIEPGETVTVSMVHEVMLREREGLVSRYSM